MSEAAETFKATLEKQAPVACDFHLGDSVFYTNDNGATFECSIVGFRPTDGVKEDFLPNMFIYLDKDSWWMPVSPGSLEHRK